MHSDRLPVFQSSPKDSSSTGRVLYKSYQRAASHWSTDRQVSVFTHCRSARGRARVWWCTGPIKRQLQHGSAIVSVPTLRAWPGIARVGCWIALGPWSGWVTLRWAVSGWVSAWGCCLRLLQGIMIDCCRWQPDLPAGRHSTTGRDLQQPSSWRRPGDSLSSWDCQPLHRLGLLPLPAKGRARATPMLAVTCWCQDWAATGSCPADPRADQIQRLLQVRAWPQYCGGAADSGSDHTPVKALKVEWLSKYDVAI